MSDNRGFEQD
ncbi:unnamed protein product, partial [Rotaria sordida]